MLLIRLFELLLIPPIILCFLKSIEPDLINLTKREDEPKFKNHKRNYSDVMKKHPYLAEVYHLQTIHRPRKRSSYVCHEKQA